MYEENLEIGTQYNYNLSRIDTLKHGGVSYDIYTRTRTLKTKIGLEDSIELLLRYYKYGKDYKESVVLTDAGGNVLIWVDNGTSSVLHLAGDFNYNNKGTIKRIRWNGKTFDSIPVTSKIIKINDIYSIIK